jgi:hypothetical protein
MVGMARFERATPASRTQCPTKLGHIPTRGGTYPISEILSITFLVVRVMCIDIIYEERLFPCYDYL